MTPARVASRSFRPLSPKRNTRPMTEARPGTARRRRGVDRRARGVARFGHSPHGWCCLRACVRDARREEGRRPKPRRAIRLLQPDHFRANVGPETNLTKRRLTKCPPAVLCGKVNSPMTPPRSRARCSDRPPRGRNSKRLPRRGTSRRHAGWRLHGRGRGSGRGFGFGRPPSSLVVAPEARKPQPARALGGRAETCPASICKSAASRLLSAQK